MMVARIFCCRSKTGELQSVPGSKLRKLCSCSEVHATITTTARAIKKRYLRSSEESRTSFEAGATGELETKKMLK